MDITLNISSAPVIKKTTNKESNNKKPTNNAKQKAPNPSFEFKWDTPNKIKPAFFNKKAQKGNAILPQKSFINNKKQQQPNDNNTINKNKNWQKQTTTATNSATDTNTISAEKPISHNVNSDFKKKGFPLFNRNSEAAKGHTYENIKGKSNVEQVFSSEGSTFDSLNIHPHTVTNLERAGIKVLTAVQEKAIPEIFAGKNVFVRSQTGSGKTLAYAIPIVETLRSIEPHINRKDGIQAIVVLPTRELVLQTYELLLKLVEPFRWIVPGRLCGGENRNSEKARLRKGINILVGTPGRLLDHILHTSSLKLDKVRCLVLDEADRLLDMGFQKDVNKLIEQIDESKNKDYDPIALMKSKGQQLTKTEQNDCDNVKPLSDINSTERQTILLSATLTSNVKDLATFTMKDYVYIDPLNPNQNLDLNAMEMEQLNTEVVVPDAVTQQFVVTDVKTKLIVLAAFIVSKAQEKNCKMFVFMASRPMVEYHELLFKKCLLKRPRKEHLNNNNVMISMDEDDTDSDEEDDGDIDEAQTLGLEFFKLHGSMDQKERTEVFKAFRAAKKGILFCTDVAARGVDIPHADYVIQYTGPLQNEDYIHRVGRTGRVGKKGLALLFLTEPELNYVKHLEERKLFLKREQQDAILKHLIPFMEHMNPASVQAAAEILHKRFEKAVLADKSLHRAACFAYSTWSRYYSSYPGVLREFFDMRKAHLGHYVTSFALRESPQQVGKFVRNDVGKTDEKKLNKKLDNHEIEQGNAINKPLRPKKRPRSQELMISEFDSGLMPSKKKKNKTK